MRKYNNKSNVCGKMIERYRKEQKMSREKLAQNLQLKGINMDRTHILRIENGDVILKDFELLIIAKILNIKFEDLLSTL